MDNITITILCSVVSAAVAWFSAINTVKKNTAEEASRLTAFGVSLEFIKDSLEEIKADLKISKDDRGQINADMGVLENRIESLEKRVERLERSGN